MIVQQDKTLQQVYSDKTKISTWEGVGGGSHEIALSEFFELYHSPVADSSHFSNFSLASASLSANKTRNWRPLIFFHVIYLGKLYK